MPKSPIHTGLIYAKNPTPNISSLGPFKYVYNWPLICLATHFFTRPFCVKRPNIRPVGSTDFSHAKLCGIRAKLIHNHNSVKSKCSTRNLLFSCHVHTVHVILSFSCTIPVKQRATSDRTKRFPDKVWY